MLANDITLDKKDGTDVVYRLVSSSPDGTRRLDIASDLALPRSLVIKHTVTGKAPSIIDRHLVQFNWAVATLTGAATINTNLTISVPRDVAVTKAIVYDVISNLVDLLLDQASTGLTTTVNIDSLLRGES